MNAGIVQPKYQFMCMFCVCMLLTLSLYFIRAPSPDNSPGLQLDLKCPSLWPLGLLGVNERQHSPQLQVSVEVVHLRVVVHPRNRSVGKEARGPCHVHFPCLLSVSSQNNLLSPGIPTAGEGETHETTNHRRLLVCRHCTHIRTPVKIGHVLTNTGNLPLHVL